MIGRQKSRFLNYFHSLQERKTIIRNSALKSITNFSCRRYSILSVLSWKILSENFLDSIVCSKYFFFRLLPAVLILCIICQCNDRDIKKNPPEAVNGILDLRTWDFKKDGNVPLNGEWEFYPNEFLPVAPLWETDRFRENKNFIKVPSKWESFQKQISWKKYITAVTD